MFTLNSIVSITGITFQALLGIFPTHAALFWHISHLAPFHTCYINTVNDGPRDHPAGGGNATIIEAIHPLQIQSLVIGSPAH